MRSSKIEKIEQKIKEADLDLKAILEEHNKYLFKGEEEVYNFIEALPIESLKESLNFQHGKPRNKMSLKDIEHIYGLRKLYRKKEDELSKLKQKLLISKINDVQEKIKKLL